ncbi:MAG: hypothetical protein AB1758_21840 [Candidatus Eremiobacterota bacterium]
MLEFVTRTGTRLVEALRPGRPHQPPPGEVPLPTESYEGTIPASEQPAKVEVVALRADTPALMWARQAVGAMGLPLASHRVLVDNLAYHLEQLTPQGFQDLTGGGPPGLDAVKEFVYRTCDGPTGDFRGALKLERELERSYSDAAVEKRLQLLDARLKERLTEAPAERMWLAGSLVKGYFGANSDVDVIVPGKVAPSRDHGVQWIGLEGRLPEEELSWYGVVVEVDPQALLEGRAHLRDFRRLP